MDKKSIVLLVIKKLEEAKEADEKSLAAARQAVVNAPGAMESHSDTTRSQMSQVAESVERAIADKAHTIYILSQFVRTKREDESTPDRIQPGTLVDVEDEKGGVESYLILPVAGGVEVVIDHKKVTVITTKSPLGALLIGKSEQEVIALRMGVVVKTLKVTCVC